MLHRWSLCDRAAGQIKHSCAPHIRKPLLLTRRKIYSLSFSCYKIINFAKAHHGKTSGISSLDFQLGPNIGYQSPKITFLALEDVSGAAGSGRRLG